MQIDPGRIINYTHGDAKNKDGNAVAYYDPNSLLHENGVIKGVFVYSFVLEFKTNKANLVFSKLSSAQLNKLKNKFAANSNPFIKTIAKAMGFDVEDMPRLFNDKTIRFSQERIEVRDSRSDKLEREYVFDLE